MNVENLQSQCYEDTSDSLQESYVTVETAKLLKEKGFNIKTEFLYEDGKPNLIESYVSNSELISECYSAPTHDLALKWLRKRHNIVVLATPLDYDDKFYIEIFKKTDGEWHLFSDEDTSLVWTGDTPLTVNYNTYEEATDEGIKYCLQILLK